MLFAVITSWFETYHRTFRRAALLGLVLFFISAVSARGETVNFPFFIDFPLLKTIALQAAFDGPDRSAVVLDEHNGCHRIVLSDPVFREKGGVVSLKTRFDARMGAVVDRQCLLPAQYTGQVSVLMRPVVKTPWVLKFRFKKLTLYDDRGKPLQLTPATGPFMQEMVSDYLEAFTFDVAPSIKEVKSFILPLIPAPYQGRAQKMLQSMRPERIATSPRGLRMEIVAEVDRVYSAETEPQALSESDLNAMVHTWEALDVFLVQLITSMAVTPLSPAAKHELMSALLESRYDFVAQRSRGTLKNDFVRAQFKEVWHKIAGILRQHLSEEPPQSALRHLAFYTASEALSILDKIGPSFGIKISRDGLLRSARLLTGDASLELTYESKINQPLRELFGLGKTLPPDRPVEPPVPKQAPRAHPSPENPGEPTSWHFRGLFFNSAWAQDREITLSEMRRWLFRPGNLDSHMAKIKGLLRDASKRVMTRDGPMSDPSFFPELVLAAAWQESCFRQFVVKEKKIVCLRSYNGTSVGLMQVNERVWRGLYDPQALRWDIRYNAQAGCEILDLYLRQYAMAKAAALSQQTLVRLVYALYNGGPGQLSKFMARHRQGDYFLSDRLFFEKYRWVTTGAWGKITYCLTDG